MVAKAEGINASESHVHGLLRACLILRCQVTIKLHVQDRILKRNTEIEAVCGRAVQIGKKHGLKTPKLECVYALVRVIECNYNKICL